jgi:hypothetical protein
MRLPHGTTSYSARSVRPGASTGPTRRQHWRTFDSLALSNTSDARGFAVLACPSSAGRTITENRHRTGARGQPATTRPPAVALRGARIWSWGGSPSAAFTAQLTARNSAECSGLRRPPGVPGPSDSQARQMTRQPRTPAWSDMGGRPTASL